MSDNEKVMLKLSVIYPGINIISANNCIVPCYDTTDYAMFYIDKGSIIATFRARGFITTIRQDRLIFKSNLNLMGIVDSKTNIICYGISNKIIGYNGKLFISEYNGVKTIVYENGSNVKFFSKGVLFNDIYSYTNGIIIAVSIDTLYLFSSIADKGVVIQRVKEFEIYSDYIEIVLLNGNTITLNCTLEKTDRCKCKEKCPIIY